MMNQKITLTIDPEFQRLIRPLTDEEFSRLRQNILDDGEVNDPIITWNGIILDGHNRWRVVQENPGISYRVRAMDFPDKWAAFEWMYKNQLGRRNLTEQQRTMLLGQMYEAAKKRVGEHKGNQHTAKMECPQNGDIPKPEPERVSYKIAREVGVSKNTVERAGQFTRGIDAMKAMGDDGKTAADKILSGKADVNKRTVRTFTKLSPEQQEQVVKNINDGKPADPPKQEPKQENQPQDPPKQEPEPEPPKPEDPPKKPLSQKEQIRVAIASLKGQGPEQPEVSEEERFLRGFKVNAERAVGIIRSEIEYNRAILTKKHTKDEARAVINSAIDSLKKLKLEF